jgi:hypothetical protein
MKYEDLQKFIISTKASKSTIYRFYKKNEDLFLETKKPNGKRLFPTDHARYFDSETMFDENKILRQENQSMRNLIDCLADKESLQHTFWQMDLRWRTSWNVTGTAVLSKCMVFMIIWLRNTVIQQN